jgi:hypothetical protein
LRLTKGWKIGIFGLVVAFIGLSLWGVHVLIEGWGNNRYTFLFSTVYFVGMIISFYGIRVRQSEKRKEQSKT